MPGPERSFVVTGGAGGIGRGDRRAARPDGHVVGARRSRDGDDAADEAVAAAAIERAEAVAPLAGWVNNAAVFRDAWLHEEPTCSS